MKYWKSNHCHPRRVDVRSVGRHRAHRLYERVMMPSRGAIGRVFEGNSESLTPYRNLARPVNLVITSTPYYGLSTYAEDQWLRLWFLGGPTRLRYGSTPQVCHRSQQTFAKSLGRVWKNIDSVADDNLKLVVRFGAIRSRNVDPVSLFSESLESSGIRWRIQTRVSCDSATNGQRQASQMLVASEPIPDHD